MNCSSDVTKKSIMDYASRIRKITPGLYTHQIGSLEVKPYEPRFFDASIIYAPAFRFSRTQVAARMILDRRAQLRKHGWVRYLNV